jgi:hypothetical protein
MKKRPIARMALGAAAALLGLMIAPVLTASAASAAPVSGGTAGTYVCTGGNVRPGTYSSMVIKGVCFAPAGTIVVQGNLTIAPGALLDAVTPGDPPKPATSVIPAIVMIGGNVFVGNNAVLALGCSPNISCSSPPGISFDRIGGNLSAINSEAVVVHSATIGGNVNVVGGGGGAVGGANSGACFAAPVPAPWSEAPGLVAGGPQYTDFEDSFVGGNLTIIGQQTCWLGSLRNQVRGSLTYNRNVTSDPDGLEIDNNLMGGNMTCLNNDPAVQYGDSGAAPNLVGGIGVGQCGFKVILPNTGPSEQVTVHMPISVSLGSLKTSSGTHTVTAQVFSLPAVTTESGYTITADLNDFALAGTGLTGSGTVNLAEPPGSTGEALLATANAHGLTSFIAFDNCTCSFGGKTGSTTIRFYGTTGANGVTSGTFLVAAGGTGVGLPTLAGWGTFTSVGQPAGTWKLFEHLRNT